MTATTFERGFRRAVITDLGDQGLRIELFTLLGKGRTKLVRTRSTISSYTAVGIMEDWLGMMVRWHRQEAKS